MRPHSSAIRFRRQALNKSIRALAREAGIDFSHLARVERGEAGLGDDHITRLAKALHVTAAEITHDDPEETT